MKGIFHCFTGTHEQALRALNLNMLLGIGGVVTFKNGKIDQFLNQIPLRILFLKQMHLIYLQSLSEEA